MKGMRSEVRRNTCAASFGVVLWGTGGRRNQFAAGCSRKEEARWQK